MKRLSADVVIIGTGGAGMMAAIEAAEKGADVLVVGKGAVGKGSCTSLAGGIFTSSSTETSPEYHYEETLVAGRGINDLGLVDLMTRKGKECLEKLRDAGVDLLPGDGGYRVDNLGNEKIIPGYRLVSSMRRILEARGIKSLSGFHCLELIMESGSVAGILGVTAEEPVVISAPSVILATGGAAAIYLRSTNPMGITGDGFAMALKAGCKLKDMEFVQFYPIGIAQPGATPSLLLPLLPSEDIRIYDAQGGNVLDELENCDSLWDAVMRFRDTASILFYRKHSEGGVFLDMTDVKESEWVDLHYLQMLSKNKFDFRTQKLRIAPIAHFFMGGVEINTRMETNVPGLFAIGEVSGGLHGANRRGGNALTECIVAGTVAGRNAASLAGTRGAVEVPESGVKDRIPDWAWERGQGARAEYGRLFKKVKKTAWEKAGIIRHHEGMQEGLELASQMESELESLTPGNITEGLRNNCMRSALLTLRCVLDAGLMRKESRGALYREDYPETDDTNWRSNIFISLDSSTGNLILEDRAIT